jgi:hypothetical protein
MTISRPDWFGLCGNKLNGPDRFEGHHLVARKGAHRRSTVSQELPSGREKRDRFSVDAGATPQGQVGCRPRVLERALRMVSHVQASSFGIRSPLAW